VTVNWFNWRPTVAALVRRGVLPEGDRAECCSANGCGGYLTEEEALRAAEVVTEVLATMKLADRLLWDGSVTDIPKDYSLPVMDWDEAEWQNRYSASYAWLTEFRAFCLRSGGFTVS